MDQVDKKFTSMNARILNRGYSIRWPDNLGIWQLESCCKKKKASYCVLQKHFKNAFKILIKGNILWTQSHIYVHIVLLTSWYVQNKSLFQTNYCNTIILFPFSTEYGSENKVSIFDTCKYHNRKNNFEILLSDGSVIHAPCAFWQRNLTLNAN